MKTILSWLQVLAALVFVIGFATSGYWINRAYINIKSSERPWDDNNDEGGGDDDDQPVPWNPPGGFRSSVVVTGTDRFF